MILNKRKTDCTKEKIIRSSEYTYGVGSLGNNLCDVYLDTHFFHGIDLSNTKITGSTFVNIDFSGANFSGSDLTGTKFICTNLADANFNNAILTDTKFVDTNILGAEFDINNNQSFKVIGKAWYY